MRPFDNPFVAFAHRERVPASAARLTPLSDFGPNPGNLLAHAFIPEELPVEAPLVVVLHGCTQNALDYDRGSGWSRLAEKQGFALLVPEQQRANNHNLCFNWFRPGDARRGRGEAASIRQMVAHLVARHGLDERRVYVTGLSAGGAMTSVMLSAYPDVFAGGAIIAGLPFATANSIPEALDRMRGNAIPAREELAAIVADSSDHDGPWPTLSVWHGTADSIVAIANADAVVDQWTALQGLSASPTVTDMIDGQRREVWQDKAGRVLIERVTVAGLGHGTPLATTGDDASGTPGAHMLEAGINSTRHIARFWGLLDADRIRAVRGPAKAAAATPVRPAPKADVSRVPVFVRRLPLPRKVAGVAEVIDKALRSAGLLR